ncbi:alpha/beta hydrolase [Nissabacter sp. SGAir0207]|uniref:alpha/beta hydrolase n=1 Tax=Nissabacter sp. SGAir0207 TaxID=2126321 RepID=UPI0010CD2DB4|nr:dienelactone hydrolase family protein [Nissabacter sp. SGAir0207]QCR38487.1 phospholipase [Nissabacter sp. SGAir0207]
MSHSLVIFLHGVGSRGSDLAILASFWQRILPAARFALPDAPFPFDGGGNGFQWFSINGVTPENRPARLAAARESFDAALSAIVSQHGFTDRLDRVALVGFSQGSIMALDAVASGRWPVAAVVAFSGRLASPPPFTPTDSPLLLIHGTADAVIPWQESERASEALKAAGMAVQTHFLPGVGHTIDEEGAARAGKFLAEVLG